MATVFFGRPVALFPLGGLQGIPHGRRRRRREVAGEPSALHKRFRRSPALILGSCSVTAFGGALDEANGRAGEIEFFAQLVLQEALEAEVQGRLLVGEEKKCGW